MALQDLSSSLSHTEELLKSSGQPYLRTLSSRILSYCPAVAEAHGEAEGHEGGTGPLTSRKHRETQHSRLLWGTVGGQLPLH